MKITEKDRIRFYSFLSDTNPETCWNWEGGVASVSGRGSFWLDGKTVLAYRASYLINVGEIPSGGYICHTCDNPRCVNPSHLFLGTNSDNMKDMFLKKRKSHSGENAPAAKFTNFQAKQIRFLCSKGISQRLIARVYGVTQTTISKIKLGLVYKEVENG